MKLPIPLICTLAFCTIVTPLPTAQAGAFIKLGDITGEVQEPGYEDTIAVHSFNSRLFRPRLAGGQRSDLGAPLQEDFYVELVMDSAATQVAQAGLGGIIIPAVEIDVTATYGGVERTQMSYTLKNVTISSYNIGSSGLDGVCLMAVTLHYTEVEWTYFKRDAAGNEVNSSSFSLNFEDLK